MKSRRSPVTRGLLALAGLVAIFAGVALLALLLWGLRDAFSDHDSDAAVAASPAAAPVTVDEVRHQFTLAFGALMGGDRAAYRAALPTKGKPAAAALDELWTKLSPLRWSAMGTEIKEIPGKPGVFDIEVTGAIGNAAPADRIVADRVLRFEHLGGRVVATGDATPPDGRHLYFMAFAKPRLLQSPDYVVVYESGFESTAKQLAALIPPARAKVAQVLGERSRRPNVLFVYSSVAQARNALVDEHLDDRMHFFAGAPETVSGTGSPITDIGIVAPYMSDYAAQPIMTHEVTHTLTTGWFAQTRHDPTILDEGIAVAVADDRGYQLLQDDLADGSLQIPLLGSFATGSLWSGQKSQRIDLAYEEGGSLVKFVLGRWGLKGLKRFSVDLAQSDLKDASIKQVVQRDLGMSWADFYAAWVQYVNTLPSY